MAKFTPQVDAAYEFFEIASDFREPQDAIREAISNAFDAKARSISIEARKESYKGEEELVLEIGDDGEGMVLESEDVSVPSVKAFFSLGLSTRRKDSNAIGKKGHGTKTYFNSRRIELWTYRDRKGIYALMDEPKGHLSEGKVPPYDVDDEKGEDKGTRIIIRGYNNNRTHGFGHDELRDFILWFTKFGSIERELDYEKNPVKELRLKGLGRDGWDKISFGHVFPKENCDIKKLREKDPASPTKYFVRRWVAKSIPVKKRPEVKLDIVFYIEGDKAKNDYNQMIRRPGRRSSEGMYSVEERYGLWACKDFIPIQRENEWVTTGQRSWTKYHAFVNCQAFRLTANRGDIGNTPEDLVEDIRETVYEWYKREVEDDKVYKQYADELEREEYYREPKQEEAEFRKRHKEALQKEICKIKNEQLLKRNDITLIAPRQEAGVLALFSMVYALNPELFKFRIIDYDTRKGYDALAEAKSAIEPSKSSFYFVEFKRTLEKDFNHSFDKLTAIVCWDCKLGPDEEVTDIKEMKRKLRITKPKDAKSYTKYMLQTDTEEHNIEVYVLKEYLRERCNINFHKRASEQH